MKFLDDLLKDPVSKRWQLSKVILCLGFFVVSAVLIKMVALHEPEAAECFMTYCALISGHNLFSKYLDKKPNEEHK